MRVGNEVGSYKFENHRVRHLKDMENLRMPYTTEKLMKTLRQDTFLLVVHVDFFQVMGMCVLVFLAIQICEHLTF